MIEIDRDVSNPSEYNPGRIFPAFVVVACVIMAYLEGRGPKASAGPAPGSSKEDPRLPSISIPAKSEIEENKKTVIVYKDIYTYLTGESV